MRKEEFEKLLREITFITKNITFIIRKIHILAEMSENDVFEKKGARAKFAKKNTSGRGMFCTLVRRDD